ncbi:MAG: NUDIX domain-containing protein [Candidatus Neomarinimicrobiota bacterium]|nr:NUDIX domain-containing protein [Candidatus Neomarinimicrobiota bacterium]
MAESIKAAGGVVVQGKRILFIKKNGRWDLPKGKLKKGANRKKTAIREVCEETGLKKKDLKILQVLIPTYHHMKLKGSINVKETFWFLVQYTGSPKAKLIPDRNEGITKCKWFDLDQLMLALKDSRPIIHYLIGFVLNEAVYKKYYKSQ